MAISPDFRTYPRASAATTAEKMPTTKADHQASRVVMAFPLTSSL